LKECIIDVDGSLAKKREIAEQQAEAGMKRTNVVVELMTIDGRLINPHEKSPPAFASQEEAEKAFEQMLMDLRVSNDLTWEEAL